MRGCPRESLSLHGNSTLTNNAGQVFLFRGDQSNGQGRGVVAPFPCSRRIRSHRQTCQCSDPPPSPLKTYAALGVNRNWCGRDAFICLHICVLLCLSLRVTGRRDRRLHRCYPTLAVRSVRGSQCLEIFVQESTVTLEKVIRVCPHQIAYAEGG